LYDGAYIDSEIIEEEIIIKGKKSYNLLIENTRNGPIVNIDPKINMILSP
jgi:acyl-homoserine lactone acylase PvdQ